jgi:DNA-binding transcriptional MerR regulator
MLGVSPNTLRSWEQRFGHPMPRRTEGGHRIFELADIEALRSALAETGDIASAISIVRMRGEGPSTPQRLRHAFAGYDESAADRLLEESLLVRSLERTIEEVLLAAVQLLGEGSPERSFATRYAAGWLAAAKRIAPPASTNEGVMIFDASAQEQLDGLYAQALELLLRRAGLRTLCLSSALAEERIGSAIRALQPNALVLAGPGARLDALGRLVHATRLVCPEVTICDFRGALPHTGASTFTSLGQLPIAAVQQLREQLLQPIRVTRTAAAAAV